MSNPVSNSITLPANVDKVMLAEFEEQVKLIRSLGVWERVIAPGLCGQQRIGLGAVRSHVSADPETGATTSYNNGLLDGIEATLELFGLEEKITRRMQELLIRG